jgi:molecular chaperone DnaK
MPQIEVTFDIDANGIIKVTASDKATGRTQHITITASSGLNEAEVERMRREAELHADEDKKRKEVIEAKNNADNAVYTAEKALREYGDKIPAETRTTVEAEVANVKKAMEGADVETIKRATDQLFQVVQQIGGSMYQQGDPQAGAPGPEAGPEQGQRPSGDEDVVDGEFRNA